MAAPVTTSENDEVSATRQASSRPSDASSSMHSELATRVDRPEEGLLEETHASTWRVLRSAPELVGEEVARARGWAICVVLLPATTLIFLPWLDGPPAVKSLYSAAAVAYILMGIWVLWTIRLEQNYTPRLFRIWGYASVVLTVPILYCLGTFSPTPLVITLGLSFFGQGLDRRHALLIPATAVVLYCILAMAILVGLLPDYGMLSSSRTARRTTA